jgi:DNA-binding NarL/FixJ family response regulator
MEPTTITVFLIDEHASMLTLFRSLLETDQDLVVAGESTNRLDPASAIVLHCPDVVVLNFTLPLHHSLATVQHIHACCPSTPVILLALFLSNDDICQAIERGVQGFVSYEAITDELVEAVRTVYAGQRYLSGNFSEYEVEPPPKYMRRYMQRAPAGSLSMTHD